MTTYFYFCRGAHLHRSQWAATNCAWCKKREERGRPLPQSKDRAIRRRLAKNGAAKP